MREMPVGRYEYRGELEGYRELVGQFQVRENEVTRVSAEFDNSMKRESQAVVAAQPQRRPDDIPRNTPPPQRRPSSSSSSQNQGNFSAPRNLTAIGLSYSQLDLETTAFSQNVEEIIGGSLSIYNSTTRFWALSLHVGYSQITLAEPAVILEEDTIDVVSYSFVMGPKIGLGPLNIFAMGGVEGNTLLFDGFEDESHTTADAIVEVGALFAPASLPFGLRFSVTIPLEMLEGDPIFTRQEIGIIF